MQAVYVIATAMVFLTILTPECVTSQVRFSVQATCFEFLFFYLKLYFFVSARLSTI